MLHRDEVFYLILAQRHQQVGERLTLGKMATHKGHFRWHNEEEVYGKAQWTRVYFVLKTEERALYIYKQKKVRFPLPLCFRNEEAFLVMPLQFSFATRFQLKSCLAKMR